jgi:hypothetical protein
MTQEAEATAAAVGQRRIDEITAAGTNVDIREVSASI